jgi:hypothetical protein
MRVVVRAVLVVVVFSVCVGKLLVKNFVPFGQKRKQDGDERKKDKSKQHAQEQEQQEEEQLPTYLSCPSKEERA